jgi:hypothetical protein
VKALIAFFALRPVFTLYGLRVIWFALLLNFAIQYFGLAAGTYASYGVRMFVYWRDFLPSIFSSLVNIALVRILLEVAAVILLSRKPIQAEQD